MYRKGEVHYRALPLPDRVQLPDSEALAAADAFLAYMRKRHSVRDYSTRPVSESVIAACIAAAGTAPSGANHQPWHFVAISDPAMKARIRDGAEEEERAFYSGGAGDEWLAALEPIGTGVRAMDGLLTCGRGQRIGLFGGSGVGKSTLLGMMARGTEADVVVLALVGERGREVRSFLEHDLGPQGLERSVVVVSTSDSPPLLRLRAAYSATAIAEHFRAAGKNVLLMMDSVTRFAMAQREVGLAAGEPPTAKGYPPSVFALLPGLLERAGA